MFQLRYLDALAPFTLIVMCIIFSLFLSSSLTLCAFLFTLVTYILLSYDSRLFMGTAVLLLMFSAGFLSTGNSIIANKIAITAYYFLVAGILAILSDYVREELKRQKHAEKSMKKST